MGRFRPLAGCLAVLFAVLLVPTAHAQDEPKFDGEAIWQALQDDPIHVLPGAEAQFDDDAVRAELRRAERKTEGSLYIVVAPFGTSNYDIREVVDQRLAEGDELITVSGVEVSTDWYSYADGKYAGSGPEGRWEDVVQHRHDQVILPTYDVTAPLVDVLRLGRGAGLTDPAPAPKQAPADRATVDEVAARLARNRLYIDPSLLKGEDDKYRFTSYDAEDFRSYRMVYLPPSAPGRPVPDVLSGLAERFPKDTVAVVRGLRIDAAGPGSRRAILTSLRYARDAERHALLWQGRSSSLMDSFYERLGQIRRGVLDPRGVPVRPPSVEETGGTLGPWAFAATGLVIGGVSVGGWLWRRARRRRAEQRAVRLGSAELAADLARLAAAVSQGEGRRRAEAAERYATAVDLTEQATTSAELAVARDVVEQAHEILDGAR